jgi:hypothetical protein
MVRAVTAPMLAASVRIFFIRSSGEKGLPFDNADGGKQAKRRRIAAFRGLFLDNLVQEFPERVVAGSDESRGNARGIDELDRRRIRGLRELIDLQVLLDRLDAGLRGAIDEEGAKEKPVAERAGMQDHITRGISPL